MEDNGSFGNNYSGQKFTLTDGSKIITEALVRSGADTYIAYPITPSNLFYSYAKERFPSFYAAPDEISVMQWMAGVSAAGKLPVSATAFPGLALMAESLNMAYMMELPMVLVLTQRLGPSTGSATTGAQGDLSFINGIISGGYPIPTLCPANFDDCWTMAHRSLEIAVKLRTPVILLTSKEMVMTKRSLDLTRLPQLKQIQRESIKPEGHYKSYEAGKNSVPPFVPLGDDNFQVRMNSSTHDNQGMIRKGSRESLDNTRRLRSKIENGLEDYIHYDLDEQDGSEKLVVTYGISTYATIDALIEMREKGEKVSLLTIKTLIPVSQKIQAILNRFQEIIIVEENLTGQLREMLFGKVENMNIRGVNKIGSMITPREVLEEVI